jgi:hypothetical protein
VEAHCCVLVSSEINKEQVQVVVDVGETFAADVSRIEIDLQKNNTMIVKQKIVTPLSMSKQDNEDEHVIVHVDINTSDILNLIYYNALPHPSSQVKRMKEVFFCQFCYYNIVINYSLSTFTPPSFSM